MNGLIVNGDTYQGPKLIYSMSSSVEKEEVTFCKQLGIKYVRTAVGEGGGTVENYRRIREKVESHGLKLWSIGSNSFMKMEEVTLGLPGRDEKIEAFKQNLRNLAAAGINYFTYDHSPLGTWRAESGEYREGVVIELPKLGHVIC